MDPAKISQTIKTFNPAARPKPDFADTWNYILNYTEGEELLEEEYKTILNYSLEGEAHRFFNSLKQLNKSLREILDAFTQLYTRRRTLDDDIADFNAFKRQQKEPIYEAIQRAKILAERLESLHSPAAWPEIKTNMLKCVLTQIISKNCKKFLATEERKHKRVGAEIDFETLIDLVEDYETAHDDIPTADIETIFNACSFSVKNDADVIMARMNARPAFRSSSKGRSKSIDSKLDKLSEQMSHINAVINKEKIRPRSPSPYARPKATTTFKPERPRRPIFEPDVEMKDTSRPTTPTRPPSPSPWQTTNKTTPMYQEYKGTYKPSQNFQPYSDKKVHYTQNNYQTPKPQFDAKKPDSNPYHKYEQKRDQPSYNRAYSSERYKNTYQRNRSQSRENYRSRENSQSRDYRRPYYRSNDYENRQKYQSRSPSRERYRSNSRGRYPSKSNYDANSRSTNYTRPRSQDHDGHKVKVLINSNDNICELCKQQIQVNSLCAITGKVHDQLN